MHRSPYRRPTARLQAVAAAVLACCVPVSGWGADTDIYGGPSASGSGPNVVFLLDNTANWSNDKQAWGKSSVDTKCNALSGTAKTRCLSYSSQIFGSESSLKQGQVELRALRLVFNELVCAVAAGTAPLDVSVGLALADKNSVRSNGDAVGLINHAVRPLVGPTSDSTTSCAALIARLDDNDAKIQAPGYKAPASTDYGSLYYEIFKYFGGHSNPTLAGNPAPNGGSPVGEQGYGPIRYSKPNGLDDAAAFTTGAKTTYKSPIGAGGSCSGNFIVLVGNAYANDAEPPGPASFQGIGYTPPSLSLVTSDTKVKGDEWSYFMANTDVSPEPGQQRVFTYAVNVYNDKIDTDQAKLLKSMAAVGGVGASAYLEVGGDLYKLVEGFKNILYNIASVNSVFTATTLPVSTTTQGTFLNQVFVGMFRPDSKASPRWVGNLKQYQLGLVNGALSMVDKNGKSATLGGAGFFAPGAESFWSESSVFFDQLPSGTPASASDLPDGAIVEKGGAAYQLRKNYLGSTGSNTAANRNIWTLDAGGSWVSFSTLSTAPSDTAMAAWVRGMNNVPASSPGDEDFVGSWDNSGTKSLLGASGARHSIHGDVLHSRPIALNYGGSDGVVVYYGANDGFFRAVDGRKTGGTAGQELWSFIAPEHHGMFDRLRTETPKLHLPETDSTGATLTAPSGSATKSYGMDGPIGVYARYNSSSPPAVTQAFIYPTMRRGGRSVYAFDVSSPTAPKYKWRIVGGATSGFGNLAQTWSMPRAVVFKDASKIPDPMLIMGGGYDPAEDSNSSGGIGNSVYIINGITGELIKELATEYSVPSDVTVVDTDFNGEPDRAYFADVRGNVYRIDFPTGNKLLPSSWSAVSAVKIASVDGKVFFPVDVVVTKSYVAIMVGTGDREKPLDVTTTDHFVLVKDNIGAPRSTALTLSDLANIATVNNTTMAVEPTTSAGSSANGCYITLATNGEKVINAPFTIAGATYFGTNRPTPSSTTTCTADLGEAYVYKFPLFCEVPTNPSKVVGGGLLPSPVGGIVTIDVGGVPTQMPFLIGGRGPSTFDVSEPKPPVPPIRTRQNWRIDNSNR